MKDPAESHSKCTWRDDLKKRICLAICPISYTIEVLKHEIGNFE